MNRTARRAFTLIELMVVISIIAVLMALLLPALNGARNAGMKASTTGMINAFTNAAASFSNDHGSQMPGYYSAAQMGHSDNLDTGMSAMENVMLDLGGTDVIFGRRDDAGTPSVDHESGIVALAPFDNTLDHAVVINTNLIGGSGAYFSPDKKFLKIMEHNRGQQTPHFDTPLEGDNDGQPLVPDVVDAFGNPLLVWVQDETARGSIDPDNGNDEDVFMQFAQTTSDAGGGPDGSGGPAWFYLASNQTFFSDSATGVGDSGVNQYGGSALSELDNDGGNVSAEDRTRTLASLLASPSYYVLPGGENMGDVGPANGVGFDEIFPARPLGRLIVQSAGVDGHYFSTTGQGWSGNADDGSGNFRINFGNNYKLLSGERLVDEDGKSITGDILGDFDDLVGTIN